MSPRKQCKLEGCENKPQPRTSFCDVHTHDWAGAAEVPLDQPVASRAVVAKKPIELRETTWVRILDVYCSSCRLPFAAANGTPCDPYADHLRGGKGKKRERHGDVDDGEALPSTA